VLSVSSFSVSGSLLEFVQYKSRVQAITVRNGIYNDEDISSKPQARCDLGVLHAEKERYRNGEKIARLQEVFTLTLLFLRFCMLWKKLQFYSYRNGPGSCLRINNKPCRTDAKLQSCVYAQALSELPTRANLIASPPSKQSRISNTGSRKQMQCVRVTGYLPDGLSMFYWTKKMTLSGKGVVV